MFKYTPVLFLFSRFAKRRNIFCTNWLSVVRGVDKQQQQQQKKKTVVVEIRLFSHDILSESDGTKRIPGGFCWRRGSLEQKEAVGAAVS